MFCLQWGFSSYVGKTIVNFGPQNSVETAMCIASTDLRAFNINCFCDSTSKMSAADYRQNQTKRKAEGKGERKEEVRLGGGGGGGGGGEGGIERGNSNFILQGL